MIDREAIDRRTSVDYIEPQLDLSTVKHCYIRVLEAFATRIGEALSRGDFRSANTAFWGSAYGMGLEICSGMSMSERAHNMGITRATISKTAQSFVTDNGLQPSFYMKSAQSHKPYSIARKSYIANGSHAKFKV